MRTHTARHTVDYIIYTSICTEGIQFLTVTSLHHIIYLFLKFFNFILSMIAGVLTVLIMNKLGKRRLTFWTLSICSFCYIAIGLIGIFLENGEMKALLVLTLFLTTTFVSSLGIIPIGWTLLSEVFPLK